MASPASDPVGGSTTAKAKTANRHVAKLSFEDGEVVVTPRDRSIFVISAEKATEACRETIRQEERFEWFESAFLLPLHDWCIGHEEHIDACYIPLPMGSIQVFLVSSSPRFNFTLAEEIADLELKLANNGWNVAIIQLPKADEASLATFFNPDGALEVYAKRGSAQKESTAKP